MPDIVNDDDLSGVAAEYVIGTLDPDERTRASVLLELDHDFRGLVRAWEHRLGELHLMVEPVAPDPKVWERIRGRLGTLLPPAPQLRSEPLSEPRTPLRTLVGLAVEAEQSLETRPVETVVVEHSAAIPAEAITAEAEPAKAELDKADPVKAELGKAEPDKTEPDKVEPNRLKPAKAELPAAAARDGVPIFLLTPAKAAHDGRRPRGRLWRAVALFMTIMAVGLGSLIAAWRFVPDWLPPSLQATAVLKMTDDPSTAEREPVPQDSQFEE